MAKTRYARLLKVDDRFRYGGGVYLVSEPVYPSPFGNGCWAVPIGQGARISFLPDARVRLVA